MDMMGGPWAMSMSINNARELVLDYKRAYPDQERLKRGRLKKINK